MAKPFYFAYGSNMSSRRLRARAPSARALGAGRFPGRRLVFDKRGRDGSAKANLREAADAEVWGVVYEIAAGEWDELDRAEDGYERVAVKVIGPGGERLSAETYVGWALTTDPVPFDWYCALVLEGAREHGLPEAYVAELASQRCKRDPRRAR